MRIKEVKINGLHNPMGYLMDRISCSWLVTETKAAAQKIVEITVSSDQEMQHVVYQKEGDNLCQAGEPLKLELTPYTRYYVQVKVTSDLDEAETSAPVWFETAKEQDPWIGQWITTEEHKNFHPAFLKKFQIKENIVSARLYISGLGLYTAKLNGKKIGEEVLTPYYSNYHEEVQYLTYDITDMVKQEKAENCLEVSLGNGWYKGHFGLAGQTENFGSQFQMIAEIRITYGDDSVETIGTDETWNYIGSDTQESDIYDGEVINHLLWDGRKTSLNKRLLPSQKES